MAFVVKFFTFSKREKSTAQPSGAGVAVSCFANEALDILAPTIGLDWQLSGLPTVYNYAYIPDFGRYYFVNNWTNADGLWIAGLRVDALASQKTGIGAAQLYVYRSATSYNLKIQDNMFPVTCRRHAYNVALPRPFTIGGASASGAASNTGVFVLGIVSMGGTSYYGFTAAQLVDFLDYLFSQNYYNTVLSDFGAANFPEAKVAINPLQYITSARFFPMGVSTATLGGFQKWTLHAGSVTGVNVGSVSLPTQDAYAFFEIAGTPIQYHTTESYVDYNITADFLHPQADERGDWINLHPYTRYELFYPPFGLVQLDPEAVSNAAVLRVKLTIDVWTGTANLEIITDPATTPRTILRLTANVAVDVPLSNIMISGSSQMELAGAGWQAVKSALALDPGGFLAAEQAAAGSIINGWIPHLSTMGSQGSTAQLMGDPKLMVTHWYVADDDLADMGRPLCQVKTLSTIPGYIKADPDSLALSCTVSEMDEIRAAISGGFFYE